MNPPKAIEILYDLAYRQTISFEPDYRDAIKLGREALKHIVYLRKDMDCPHWMTLPGED